MGMTVLAKVALAVSAVALGCVYQATRPPPPAILGAPGGPRVTSPRVRLKDGRHLAYLEGGVRREAAKYKIIFSHGFASTKENGFPVSQELAEEMRIYLLFFDRAGYGDSDVNPKRGLRSDATDVEELADALQLGDRFYLVGSSMGGYTAWSCLHYTPHRLLQAGRSGAGRAGGELLVADACRRVESCVREAGRQRPEDVLDSPPHAVAVLRLAHTDVVPDVADRQGGARRVHRQGLGDPNRAPEEGTGEWPGGSGQSNTAGHIRIPVPRRDDLVRHMGIRSHQDQEPVPRRRWRRQHLAGVRGQDRPGGGPAPRGADAAVGAVPRAPRSRARAPEHGWSRGRDHQGALARW